MAKVDINRASSGIELPFELSSEIWQKATEDSSIMTFGTQIEMLGSGIEVPMITADPEANWVDETEEIKASKGTATNKKLKPCKMGILVPFSNEFLRDMDKLYEAMVARFPAAIAKKFDQTCYGFNAAPSEQFETMAGIAEVELKEGEVWKSLVSADAAISTANGLMDGFVFAPKAKSRLLLEKDANDRPLFINSYAEGGIPQILSTPTQFVKNVYNPKSSANAETLGIAGDWTNARWGIVDGMTFDISTQSTITIDGQPINLWQRDMFAVKLTVECGFGMYDKNCFVRLTGDKAGA